jgi:hypothetical protein
VFLCYCGWKGAEKDATFEDAQRAFVAEVEAFAKNKGRSHPYIYLPYAFHDQQPLESYGAVNVDKIRAAARKHDPEGVFQTMVPGGFKISRVGTTEEGSADTKFKEEQVDQVEERRTAENVDGRNGKDEL